MNIMQNLVLVIAVNLVLLGCSSMSSESNLTSNNASNVNSYESNTLHGHVEKLMRQLLSTSQPFDTNGKIAVGTILPSTLNDGEQLPAHANLSLQIQESLMTFAAQAGLQVVEFKAMPSIKILETEKMLSRNVEELPKTVATDYFLTGTYTPQESTTLINIRLIKIPDNIILAAATDYVPNDTMWSKTKVTVKNRFIYRNEY